MSILIWLWSGVSGGGSSSGDQQYHGQKSDCCSLDVGVLEMCTLDTFVSWHLHNMQARAVACCFACILKP